MNSRSREGFYTIWTLAIVLCVILALFAVFFVSCTKAPDDGSTAEEPAAQAQADNPDSSASAEPTETPEPTAVPISTQLAESADQGTDYISKFVFLGDSTTYGLAANDVLPETQVWTPESGTLTLSNQSIAYVVNYDDDGSSQQMLIPNAAALRKPEYLVITLGINGIAFMAEDEFKTQYIDLIESIQSVSPNTKIICQSIFPVIDSMVDSSIQNSAINTANGWILEIAEQTQTRYLNTRETLVDTTGNLQSEYCNGDGIHLSAAGGNAVLAYIRTHAYA